MQLLDLSKVSAWLNQFEPADRDAAVALLNGLLIVPTDTQDADLQAVISKYYCSLDTRVALFACREIDKDEAENARPYFVNGRPRPMPETSDVGSEGRIARFIRNASRASKNLYAHPTFASALRHRPTIFLIVDDFAGSGNRICKFAEWLYDNPRIKSLHSFGKIRFHAISALCTPKARDRVRNNPLIESFEFGRFGTTFETSGWALSLQKQVRALAITYGLRTSKPRFSLGFDRSESLTLLGHSCPNNVPSILWSPGRTWLPLFPHGQIPEDLFQAILSGERLTLGARLEKDGTNATAAGARLSGLTPFARKLILFLKASVRYRHPLSRAEQLAMILGLALSEIEIMADYAKRHDLVDSRGRITDAGRFELERLKETDPADELPAKEKATKFYFPKSLKRQAVV